MANCAVIILAAGEGKRMRSQRAKVLHELSGRSLIHWVLAAARSINPDALVAVTGHRAEEVEAALAGTGVKFVRQEPQLGTGHAVLCALPALDNFSGPVFVLCGDVPLVPAEVLGRLLEMKTSSPTPFVMVSSNPPDAAMYGRLVRDEKGCPRKIVEFKDASSQEKAIREINTGLYVFDTDFLRGHLNRLAANNAQKEYYLTDLVAMAYEEKNPGAALLVDDPYPLMGINSQAELAAGQRFLWQRKCRSLMEQGVTIYDPETTYIDEAAAVEKDTVIHPGVHLLGQTIIGAGCVIGPYAVLSDCEAASGAVVAPHSVLKKVKIPHP